MNASFLVFSYICLFGVSVAVGKLVRTLEVDFKGSRLKHKGYKVGRRNNETGRVKRRGRCWKRRIEGNIWKEVTNIEDPYENPL